VSNSVPLTVDLDAQLSADLDRLAVMRNRDRSWLVAQAVAAFVAEELELRGALAEADAEDGVSHEEFMAALKAEYGTRRAA
jgi:predicted transcriptional regulator